MCTGAGARSGSTRFRRRFRRFGAEPGHVQQGSGEGSGEGLGGFGAEPGEVQQGSREGSGEGLGGLSVEPGEVQQGFGTLVVNQTMAWLDQLQPASTSFLTVSRISKLLRYQVGGPLKPSGAVAPPRQEPNHFKMTRSQKLRADAMQALRAAPVPSRLGLRGVDMD